MSIYLVNDIQEYATHYLETKHIHKGFYNKNRTKHSKIKPRTPQGKAK